MMFHEGEEKKIVKNNSYTINPKRGRRVSESKMKKELTRLNKVLKKLRKK